MNFTLPIAFFAMDSFRADVNSSLYLANSMMNGTKAGFDRISTNLESALQVKPISLPIALLLAAATATEAQITFVDAIHGTNTFKTGSTLSHVSWVDTISNNSKANNTQWFERPTCATEAGPIRK